MRCPDCGNNPVPHALVWIDSLLMGGANDLAQGRFARLLPFGFSVWASDRLSPYFVRFLMSLGVIRASEAIDLSTNDRTRVLWEEARKRHIPFRALTMFGRQLGMCLAEVKGKRILISGVPRPAVRKSHWDFWLDDKAIVKEKLAAAGVAVPRGGRASSWRDAKKIFERIEKPVIVKPRLGSRGRHTTTNISTEKELRDAFHIAKQLCYWVVVEEHLIGSVYRCTLIDGKSAGILRGDPPRVTGDGTHTIEELVEIKNKTRHRKVSQLALTAPHDRFLARSGRKRTDVIPAGQTIDVLEKIGVSYGGNSSEDTNKTHPGTIAILEQAGKELDDPIIGLDFIIADIAADPAVQKWGIIECNACPFINLHHDPVEGEPRNVAGSVWDYVERSIGLF